MRQWNTITTLPLFQSMHRWKLSVIWTRCGPNLMMFGCLVHIFKRKFIYENSYIHPIVQLYEYNLYTLYSLHLVHSHNASCSYSLSLETFVILHDCFFWFNTTLSIKVRKHLHSLWANKSRTKLHACTLNTHTCMHTCVHTCISLQYKITMWL